MEMICYCFGYSEADIANDVIRHNGRSTIMEMITENKKNGMCQCGIYNPKKR